MAPPPSKPSWLSPLPDDGTIWFIDCIKSGITLGSLPLNGPDADNYTDSKTGRYTIGRGEEVNIEISGDLSSRLHGVIDFFNIGSKSIDSTGQSDAGFPFYKDCSSTHGSYINKRKVPFGSKHVKIYDGDQFVFGVEVSDQKVDKKGNVSLSSTSVNSKSRIYIIRCEGADKEKYERQVGSISQRKQMHELNKKGSGISSSNVGDKVVDREEVEEVSWGFRDDAIDEESDEEEKSTRDSSSSSSSSLPDYLLNKQNSNQPTEHKTITTYFSKLETSSFLEKKYTSYKTSMAKLKNLQSETEKLLNKQDSGKEFTGGQEARLTQLQGLIVDSEQKVSEIEEELLKKIGATSSVVSGTGKKGRHVEDQYNDEDDDFYDRTLNTQQAAGTNKVETLDSLSLQHSTLKKALNILQSETLPNLQQNLKTLKRKKIIDEKAEDYDPIDSYMIENEIDKLEKDVKSCNSERKKVEENLEKCRRLLGVISNNKWKEEEEIKIEGGGKKRNIETIAELEKSQDDESSTNRDGKRQRVSQESEPVKTSLSSTPEMEESPKEKPMLPPPSSASTSNIKGPMPPPSASSKKGPMPPPSASNKKGPMMPARGPALPPASTTSNFKQPTKKKQEEKNMKPNPELSSKEVVWQAPSDQDGTGKTKLNLKFANRY